MLFIYEIAWLGDNNLFQPFKCNHRWRKKKKRIHEKPW